MHFLITTLSALALLTSSLATADSCSTYTPSGFPYTRPIDRTQIISKGIVCESTTTDCLVDIGGYVTNTRTLNVSVSDLDPLFSLISNVVGFGFNDTVTQFIRENPDLQHPQTWPIPNGTAGYVGWTGHVRCTAGKLSGCDGDDEALEDVQVEACTPYASTTGVLSGSTHEISTNDAAARAIVCNPANTTRAKEGNNTNSCTTEDEKTGDAVKGQASMVLLVMALGLAVFGFGDL